MVEFVPIAVLSLTIQWVLFNLTSAPPSMSRPATEVVVLVVGVVEVSVDGGIPDIVGRVSPGINSAILLARSYIRRPGGVEPRDPGDLQAIISAFTAGGA